MYPHQHIQLDRETANRILRKSAITIYINTKKSANILISNKTYKINFF